MEIGIVGSDVDHRPSLLLSHRGRRPESEAQDTLSGSPGRWLGCKDSNLEMQESESCALPFGDTPVQEEKCGPKIEISPLFVK